MRLMLDLDGVLADFHSGLFKEARKLWPDRVFRYDDIIGWDLVKDCANIPLYNDEEFNLVYSLVCWGELERMPDFDKYRKMVDKAKYVRVVTNRPKEVEKDTLEWLYRNGVKFDDLILEKGFNKWRHCKGLTHVMDDCDDNINWIKRMCSNVKVISVPRPWNHQKEGK